MTGVPSASEAEPPAAAGQAEPGRRAAWPDPWRVVFDLVVLAAVAVYLATAPSYSGVAHLFPEAVGYPTAALAVAAVIRSLAGYLRARAAARRAGTSRPRDLARYQPLIGFGLVVGYAALLPSLGFRLATPLLLIAGSAALGTRLRRLWIVAITAVVFTFVLGLLFSPQSGIILPAGLWG